MHRSKQEPIYAFKDSCNSKSNQKNLGCIKFQPVRGDHRVHVVRRSSGMGFHLSLDGRHRRGWQASINFDRLRSVVNPVINLNKIIDRTTTLPRNRDLNLKHRPIVVQGFSPTFHRHGCQL
jgi:hypothetical protein